MKSDWQKRLETQCKEPGHFQDDAMRDISSALDEIKKLTKSQNYFYDNYQVTRKSLSQKGLELKQANRKVKKANGIYKMSLLAATFATFLFCGSLFVCFT